MAGINRVSQDGKLWYPVSFAARQLHTSTPKVRELMGRGTLEWCQKGRSKILLVSVESLERYRRSDENPHNGKINRALRSPDPLARRPGDLPKLGDRRKPQPGGFGVFVPTWDPRSGREAIDCGEGSGLTYRKRESVGAEKQGTISPSADTTPRSSVESPGSRPIDPELMALGFELAVFHLEHEPSSFLRFIEIMEREVGECRERMRPYLRAWYNSTRDLLEDSGHAIDCLEDPTAVQRAYETLWPPNGGHHEKGTDVGLGQVDESTC